MLGCQSDEQDGAVPLRPDGQSREAGSRAHDSSESEERSQRSGGTSQKSKDGQPGHLLWGGIEGVGTSDSATNEVNSESYSEVNLGQPDGQDGLSSPRGKEVRTRSSKSARTKEKKASRAPVPQAEGPDPRLHVAFDSSDSASGVGGAQEQGDQLQDPAAQDLDEETFKLIPRDESGALMSVGSIRHATAECKPCLFVHTSIGCHYGYICTFCHFGHNRKQASRPCKSKRIRYKNLITRMEKAKGPHGATETQAPDKE